MQFVKIATAAALAMGVTTFAVAQERVQHNDQLNRSAPSSWVGDHDRAVPQNRSGVDAGVTSGATGGDARTAGAVTGPITEKNVGPMLQAQGYTDVKGVKKSGNTITANAKKDGKSVKLKVDSKTGAVAETRS